MNVSAPSQLEQLEEYADELKRHTKGRRAIHVQMSRLLKHHQEAAFRHETSAFIKPLIDKFPGSRNFSLSNHDLMVVMNGAKFDDIEPTLVKIRRHFKGDPVIDSLDPIQGKSDNFTAWYDLEMGFSEFVENIKLMTEAERAGEAITQAFKPEKTPVKPSTITNMADDSYSRFAKPVRTIRAVQIERTDAHIEVPKKPLDADTILKLEKFILVMDLGAYIRSQNIIVIVGKGKPAVAMIEKLVHAEEVVGQLIKEVDLLSNVWLRGYLDDVIAERFILSQPEVKNKSSLATMVPLTIKTILGSHFATFEQSHKSIDRSAIIIELSLMDVLSDTVRFETAQAKVRGAGYKLAISQIDPFALTVLDPSSLSVDFFKVDWRATTTSWLRGENHEKFKNALHRIGLTRVIISGCDSEEAINTMRPLGAILFEGAAVDNYKPEA